MDLLFQSWQELTLTENHLKQLHGVLLSFSEKDEYHRGQYKRAPNNVVAYDKGGKEIGVIFEIASPFPFVKDDKGQVTHLVLHQNNADQQAKKIR